MTDAATPIIDLEHVSRVYQMGHVDVPALADVSLQVMPGEFVAIVGPSGSGKTTMMNILGCLDRPTAGQYRLAGTPVERPLRRRARAAPQPDDRLRLPVVQPAAADDRPRQRRHAAALPGRLAGEALGAGEGRARAARPRRPPRPRADRAVGRPAAARRRRPGDRHRAGAHPRRRADRQPRQPLRRRGHGAPPRAQRRGPHDRPDHPRRGRVAQAAGRQIHLRDGRIAA